jgi:hypothetical protein
MWQMIKSLKTAEVIGFLLLVSGLVVLIVYLWLLFAQDEFIFGAKINLQNSSLIATFISGTIGTLWTLASIMFVISTLRLSRDQLNESKRAFEQQQFDNIFFTLLNMHHDFVNNLSFKSEVDQAEYSGREYLLFVKQELETKFDFREGELMAGERIIGGHPRLYWATPEAKSEIAVLISQELFKSLGHSMESYFSNIFSMLRLISQLPSERQRKYFEICQGHLSNVERFNLYYYVKSCGSQEFKDVLDAVPVARKLPDEESLELRLTYH